MKLPDWNPQLGYSGEVFSVFEVIRKINELWMGKVPTQQNYEMSPTIEGFYEQIGGGDTNATSAHTIWPLNVDDKFLGNIPTVDVVKQYVKSEWTNQTQRPYWLEFYEIQSKRTGPHSQIGDPWTQFIKELRASTQGTIAGTTRMGFPGLDAANYPGEQYMVYLGQGTDRIDDGTTAGSDFDQIKSVGATTYPVRPEWLPAWNKAWKFKKTKVLLEPGQTHTFFLKGWTGKFNCRKMFSGAYGAVPNFNSGGAYSLNGVQKNMNRWILVGAYPDLVGTKTDTGTPIS